MVPFRRLSNGTVPYPTGPYSRRRRPPHRRFSTVMPEMSCSVRLMLVADSQKPDLDGRHSYAEIFAAALLDPDRATPAAAAGPNGKAARKRYNVYRNNVTVSLIDALAAVFPATMRITGTDFFRAMARFPCAGHSTYLAAS